MKNKILIIIELILCIVSVTYANPVNYIDYPEMKAADPKSDASVIASKSNSLYLSRERIEVTIDDYESAFVRASYTLKHDDKMDEIHLQLPFMEAPVNLKIEMDNEFIEYEVLPYKHTMQGYARTFHEKAETLLNRNIPQLEKLDEWKLNMNSITFSLNTKGQEEISFNATYNRKIGFHDTRKLEKVAEEEDLRDEAMMDKAQMDLPQRQFYRDISGYLYNYTYLFQTGLTWPEPIEKAELIIKIDHRLIQSIITEKELLNHDKNRYREKSNSANSLFAFNEDGQRQTCLLTEGKIEGDYRVFYFEKENWKPSQNAGIVWLGTRVPEYTAVNEMVLPQLHKDVDNQNQPISIRALYPEVLCE